MKVLERFLEVIMFKNSIKAYISIIMAVFLAVTLNTNVALAALVNENLNEEAEEIYVETDNSEDISGSMGDSEDVRNEPIVKTEDEDSPELTDLEDIDTNSYEYIDLGHTLTPTEERRRIRIATRYLAGIESQKEKDEKELGNDVVLESNAENPGELLKESKENGKETQDATLSDLTGATCTVSFYTEGDEDYPDQEVPWGGFITKPEPDPELSGYEFYGWFTEEWDPDEWDPDAEGAEANMWDFEKMAVTKADADEFYDLELYAYYIPTYQFASDFMILSSTGKLGYYTETVIGQGCTVKLNLANQDGTKLKLDKNAVSWNMVAVPNDGDEWNSSVILKNDSNLGNYFKLQKKQENGNIKNGKIKCNKNAKTGYRVLVSAQYQNKRAYYIMTVMPKIKKFGFSRQGKIVSKLKADLTLGATCYFGYGPYHYMESGYPYYYDKTNQIVGVGLYGQSNGDYWTRDYAYSRGILSTAEGQFDNTNIQLCSAKIPKKVKVNHTSTPYYYYGYSNKRYYYFKGLDYFTPQKAGSYKVQYIAPDGSGKKLTLTYKVKKPKKTKSSKK